MKIKTMSVKKLACCGIIAALYVALCLALAPFSYGAVQVRVAEALCLLPVFGPEYIVGVTLGCFLSNLLGSTMIDVVFGTLATLLACLCTYKLRHLRVKGLALVPSLPPVVLNAVIVGLEISLFFTDGAVTLPVILMNMVTVGIGEIISCCVLGVCLVRLIETNRELNRLATR
ncbi:MAG: QueT transporter family protein [Gemmiger sp.]